MHMETCLWIWIKFAGRTIFHTESSSWQWCPPKAFILDSLNLGRFSKEGDESKSIGLKGPFLLFDTRKPKLQEKSGLVQSHAGDCIRAVEAGVFRFWTTDVLLWSFIFLAQFFGKLESAFVVGMCQGIRFFAQMIHAGSLHCPCDLYDGFLIQVCTYRCAQNHTHTHTAPHWIHRCIRIS